jgi:predicted Zn-dependent protease
MCANHDHAHEPASGPIAMASPGLHRRDIVRGLWAGSMVLGASAAGGCASTAAFFAPSDAELIPMAAQAWEQTKREQPISRDATANRRLNSIGMRIATAANRPDDQWEFVVFDSDELNAFVLPGGKVGFYKGLLDFVDNDDQAAAVLGHEVGHVTRRHAALRAGQQQATQIGMALVGVGIATSEMSNEQKQAIMALAGAGATVGVILPFSRQNELEADIIGVDYMHAANYDVRQSISLWEKMGAANKSRSPNWLSTHPNPEQRVQPLRTYINNKGYALV